MTIISGFSRLPRNKKLEVLLGKLHDREKALGEIESYRHPDPEVQKLHDEFSENTITNFHLPYGIAPNFLINGRPYMLPMVTEESSVVAAAARSAKFWSARGGFRTRVDQMIKNGQLHFTWNGDHARLKVAFPELKERLLEGTGHITSNMKKRGGGIVNIELVDKREVMEGYYQISAGFDTGDSMGANFINSCLEEFGSIFKEFLRSDQRFGEDGKEADIIMAILSNYTDGCLVTAEISCETDRLQEIASPLPAGEFASKFCMAVRIAETDIRRAVTHNKGIFNGIDAVVMATGNDFRAVEAAGHAWAARSGRYGSLSESGTENGSFFLRMTIPLAVGTVGGITGLHPMARRSLEILGNPGAKELMGIIAAGGLATNFAAVSSLVTSGIQSGHMRMHLSNILNRLGADRREKEAAVSFFSGKNFGYASVEAFVNAMRKENNNGNQH
jgi:hydroxymethylglutaryl-CoA reductase